MTKRFYVRYAGKEGFEERFEVVNVATGETTAREPYEDALRTCKAKEAHADAIALESA